MPKIVTVGRDLAKNMFQMHGSGASVRRKSLKRGPSRQSGYKSKGTSNHRMRKVSRSHAALHRH